MGHASGRDGANGGSPDGAVAVDIRWERGVIAASGGEATLLVRVTAKPVATARRTPVDVAFVLDRSGSMAGDKLDLVKRAVDVAVGHLRDDDRVALVVYDNAVDTLQALEPATPRAKTTLRLALAGVDAGGSTDLAGGWLTGCRALSGEDDAAAETRIRRALLLTDGLANAGITDPAELALHAGELRRRGIGTTTLGVGLDFDERLLGAMAEGGGGNFQFVSAPEQLRPFFERELKELLAIAAVDATVVFTAPDGIALDLVTAFPCERRNESWRIALGDLAAAGAIDLVFDVRIPAGTVGTVYRLDLTLAWTDPTADRRREERVAAPPLATVVDAAAAEVTADPFVAERAALQRATAARRVALDLDRAGRTAESRERMRSAAAALAAAPQTADVARDLAITERYVAMAAPYGEFEHKQATWQNALRRRGRTDDAGTSWG